jgi:predicted RNase H-like HicB family nuclease
MRVSLTAIYEPVEGGWTQARIEEIPGVITAAPTLDKAKILLLDALREYLLALRPETVVIASEQACRETLSLVVEA